jgi:UDP-N-acetylmuramoyl-tripeptide--D-alanyl-D-alanine ligase
MRDWDAARIAACSGARLVRDGAPAGTGDGAPAGTGEGAGASMGEGAAPGGPAGVAIDSRTIAPGELFVGLRGERTDGGGHAAEALARGAWGVLVSPEHVRGLEGPGAVLEHADPLAALQALAAAWRSSLDARVVAITGSVGKTSTKDILGALLRPQMRVVTSPANYNTEVGLPLAVLAAPRSAETLVLEMAMRGPGQIAELTRLARPDAGAIVNVGPVHLELLGSREAVAAAKAELIGGLASGTTIVLPADEPLLQPYRRDDLRTVTFGPGGDVDIERAGAEGEVAIRTPEGRVHLRTSFSEPHNLRNLLPAVALAQALGAQPGGELHVTFSALRGERIELHGGVTLLNDCYNANPMSMRAALENLARAAPGRRVAVLGDMLELGPEELPLHREVGAQAGRAGVELLVAVGPLASAMADAFPGEARLAADAREAAELLGGLLRDGDTVLVKGSRALRLERVAELLAAAPRTAPPEPAAQPAAG